MVCRDETSVSVGGIPSLEGEKVVLQVVFARCLGAAVECVIRNVA